MVEAIAKIAFQTFLGLPLIAWGGLVTILCLFITAYIGSQVHKGKIDFKYHKIAIIITLILAVGHALFAVLSFIG